jgi:signal peptidase I
MDQPDLPSHEPAPPSGGPIRQRSAYRLLLVLSVGFVCLFLFIRAAAVEPFGVPTGSMAPALIGNHREGPCPRCGYPVRVGFPAAGGSPSEHFERAGCPNCGFGRKREHSFSLAQALDLAGDRVLVDKNVFNLRRPRRWEMAVFRCPDPDPKELGKPYVKRVVGLPGETITLINGDAYADDELLRKDLDEVRETRVIVHDMTFDPAPGGWHAHWGTDGSVLAGSVLTLDATRADVGLSYRNWNIDERVEEPVKSWSSYDGVPRSFALLPPAHDFSFECEVEVVSAASSASFACRLFDGADAVNAEIPVGPRGEGRATLGHGENRALKTVERVGLRPGRRHRVEFAFVDRRATLALDGEVVAAADLPPVEKRAEVARPLQLGARRCHLRIRHLKIYRDTYYTQYGENGTRRPAALQGGEYFMLGDNSGNSQDSRKWPRPGVPEADLVGKPFLIHQPLRTARVTVGGRERIFQTVDWSRLRWLH